MIVSHKYRFIFIKTAKTASTSIEIALSQYCSNNDIITPLITKDENFRRQLGYKGPQNYHLRFRNWDKRDFLYFLKHLKPHYYGGHCSAKFVKKHINKTVWDTYYKFCFDRNPWDKAISLYYWQTRNLLKRPSFSTYLNNVNLSKLSNYRKYSDSQLNLLVDKVYKYESLEESIIHIKQKLNLPHVPILPRTKNKVRKDNSHYSTYFNEEQKQIIYETCVKEIELLGYKYNQI